MRPKRPAADCRIPIVLLALLAVPILFAPGPAGAQAVTRLVDGVPHVMNPAVPRDGAVDIRLEELWRDGGEDSDRIFGMISRIRSDADGNVYVMDAQLSEVHVYSPDGDHLRTLFGQGDGPGEIRGPRDIVLMDDGRVGAVQEVPGKLIFVDRGGDPAGSLTIGGGGQSHGGFCQTFSAFGTGDPLLVAGFVQGPGEQPGHFDQTAFLSSFDADGRQLVDYAKTVNDIDLSAFVFDETKHLAAFWWNAAVAPSGDVHVAPDLARYAIEVRGRDGALKKVIERDYAPWKRSQAEKEHFEEMVQAIYHGAPIDVRVKCMDTEPVIVYFHRGLRMHPDGEMWILSTRGLREPDAGAMASFDVFDTEGVFTRRVNVRGTWNGRSDGVFFLDDDHAVVVTGYADAMVAQFTGGHMAVEVEDEAGSVEVIYCRVVR